MEWNTKPAFCNCAIQFAPPCNPFLSPPSIPVYMCSADIWNTVQHQNWTKNYGKSLRQPRGKDRGAYSNRGLNTADVYRLAGFPQRDGHFWR